MTECRHLYEFAYRCGHSGWERLDRRLTRAEYYGHAAGKCPACRAVDEAAEAARQAELAEMGKKLLPESHAKTPEARWAERALPCPKCNKLRALRDTPDGPMCIDCARAHRHMDDKYGYCDACGIRKKRVVRFSPVNGGMMVCRYCWEDVTGTPMSWARAIGKKAL